MAVEVIPTVSRRERQREETRRDLAFAALELAGTHGLANVRVPEIAAAAGVSPRTFNNYFHSKEEAITWPARRRGDKLADALLDRPEQEPIGLALVAAVSDLHATREEQEFPRQWMRKFRALVAREPALHGEYLKAADATERALAEAIRARIGASEEDPHPELLAAVAVGAERAAIRHWMKHRRKGEPLADAVRSALQHVLVAEASP